VRLACDGNHKLLRPIRPIALTLCDALALVGENKLLAAILGGLVVLLLLYAHFAAAHLESQTFDLIYAIIKAYLSKKVTGLAYQGVLYWAMSYGMFFAFRLGAYVAVCAAHQLGRDVVFALSLLLALTLIAGLAGLHLASASANLSGQLVAWAIIFTAYLGWFWSRYMSGGHGQHRSFDYDIGVARMRLRPH